MSGALDLDNNVIFTIIIYGLCQILNVLSRRVDESVIRLVALFYYSSAAVRGHAESMRALCYQSVGELSMAGQSTMLSLLDRNR